MDELVIEDKKYVSSKQAAKLTGYAKDYIGQLCREGRLPARLVGRNWYVLESAIRDHRFGGETTKQEPARAKDQRAFVSAAWESPRYEPAPIEELLSPEEPERPEELSEVSHQKLQETWKEWFEQVAQSSPIPADTDTPIKADEDSRISADESAESATEEVQVPIRPIYQHIPKALLPNLEDKERVEESLKEIPRNGYRNRVASTIYVAGTVAAVCSAVLATIGTGYFDKYLESDRRASMLAGIIATEIDR